MKAIAMRVMIAALLLAAAAICWSEARLSNAVASAHERTATLQRPADESIGGRLTTAGWLRSVPGSLDDGLRRWRGQSLYWSGRYDELAKRATQPDTDADPEMLLMSANAAFRQAQQGDTTREASVQRLTTVLQAYATVLKTAFTPEASYNYEYVARLRDTMARPRASSPRTTSAARPPAPATTKTDDLPAGPTIHGGPGRFPAPARGNEFEIITPMEYGEREAQPEATPGRKLPRKG